MQRIVQQVSKKSFHTTSLKFLPTGNIKFFDQKKGFGFITTEDGNDVFVHATRFTFSTLQVAPGDAVVFDIIDGKKGKEATNVKRSDSTA